MNIRDIEQTQLEEARTVVDRQDAVYCSLCNDPDPSTQTYELDPIPTAFAYPIAAGTVEEDDGFRASKYYRLVLCEDHTRELFGSVPPMRGYRVPYEGDERSTTLAGQMEALNKQVGEVVEDMMVTWLRFVCGALPVMYAALSIVAFWLAAGLFFPFSLPAALRRVGPDDQPTPAAIHFAVFVFTGTLSALIWARFLLPALGALFGIGLGL